MEERETEAFRLYADWFAVWGLLGCMFREFFYGYCGGCPPENRVEQMRQRAEEMKKTLEDCQEKEWLQLKDVARGGGYADILRGLSTIAEQIENGGGRTEKEWLEIESLVIQIKIHAWAQKMRALISVMEEERLAETLV